MTEKAKPVTPTVGNTEDEVLDLTLRPKRLAEYVGQSQLKDNLAIFLGAAKKRKQPMEHVLLHGAPGLGKTTLAYVIANEVGVPIRVTSGPAIERAGDLAAILTNLEPGQVLFIDEIHRLPRIVEEVLYPALEEFAIDIVIGKGPAARTLRLDLPKFTLIGATTRLSLLSSPLRDRFGTTYHLHFYDPQDLTAIVDRSARLLNVPLTKGSSEEISKRARRTPRVANRLLKRVRDFAEVKGHGTVTPAVASEALDLLAIDPFGLDPTDRRILEALVDTFRGGPVGVRTLAAAVAEDAETVEDLYEPFLLQAGFLARTPRGRVATEATYRHLGRAVPPNAAQATLIP
jgi:Holliday junction DNA helicase RuvB